MQPIRTLRFRKLETDILEKLGLEEKKYFVATVHRAENVDNKERLGGILNGFSQIYKEFGLPIIFPGSSQNRENDRRIWPRSS